MPARVAVGNSRRGDEQEGGSDAIRQPYRQTVQQFQHFLSVSVQLLNTVENTFFLTEPLATASSELACAWILP